MNTARQAMENMEYVRRLLDEKQAGFAAPVELAVSIIHRQIAAGGNDGNNAAAWPPRDNREAGPGAPAARGAAHGSRPPSPADAGRRLKLKPYRIASPPAAPGRAPPARLASGRWYSSRS